MPGEPTELYVRSRRALLDALEQHLDALVLVGAQAIYMHTGEVDEAIATETKDSDLVVDPQPTWRSWLTRLRPLRMTYSKRCPSGNSRSPANSV